MRIQTSYSLLSCLAALLLIAPGAQAQTLRGVVQDESTGVAIEGALLLLLDDDGDLMGTILSDETGLRRLADTRFAPSASVTPLIRPSRSAWQMERPCECSSGWASTRFRWRP